MSEMILNVSILILATIVACSNVFYTHKFYRTYEVQLQNIETRLKVLETKRHRIPKIPPKSELGPESSGNQAMIQLDKHIEDARNVGVH